MERGWTRWCCWGWKRKRDPENNRFIWFILKNVTPVQVLFAPNLTEGKHTVPDTFGRIEWKRTYTTASRVAYVLMLIRKKLERNHQVSTKRRGSLVGTGTGFLWNCLEGKELVHRWSRSCSVNETVLGFTAVYYSTASHEREQNLVSFTIFANPLNLGQFGYQLRRRHWLPQNTFPLENISWNNEPAQTKR